MLSDQERAVIVEVLCGQSLADHLGDVRDTEEKLWDLIGAPKLHYSHRSWNSDSAWQHTAARLKAAGIPLPEHLQVEDDEEE